MSKDLLIAIGIFLGLGIVLLGFAIFLIAPNPNATVLPLAADLDAETLRVAKGLYCPVCPGVPLDVCDTQACEQWRALIKQKLSEGQSAPQIESYFVEQYGERVLGAPRAAGLNILIYAIPAFVVSAGAAGIFLFARSRTLASVPASGQTGTPHPAPELPNAYRSRIERELREND